MNDKFYWCSNCLLSLNQNDIVRIRVCRKCNHTIDIYESKLDCLLDNARMITGIETKEDLIRYIVCEGEPADESCIGHPVLFNYSDSNRWIVSLLLRIDEDRAHKHDSWQKYISINYTAYAFARKMPGYDYTQKVCANCDNERQVCEFHPEVPWGNGDGCCGGAGEPCICSPDHRENRKKLR